MDFILLASGGLLLGISLAAPPGPITSMLINRATRSIPGAVLVGLGAMTADFILMLITIFIGSEFSLYRYVHYIYPVGAAFFIYLGYRILISRVSEGQDNGRKGGYISGVSVGLLNPLQIGWWLTAGLGVYERFGILTIIFLFAGALLWVFILTGAVRIATKKFENRMEKIIKIFSSMFLFVFGAVFIYLFFV